MAVGVGFDNHGQLCGIVTISRGSRGVEVEFQGGEAGHLGADAGGESVAGGTEEGDAPSLDVLVGRSFGVQYSCPGSAASRRTYTQASDATTFAHSGRMIDMTTNTSCRWIASMQNMEELFSKRASQGCKGGRSIHVEITITPVIELWRTEAPTSCLIFHAVKQSKV